MQPVTRLAMLLVAFALNATLGAGLAAAGQASAADAGQIKTAKGTAHVERDGQRIAITPGMRVRQSDTIVTGADGTVGITLTDNSLLSAGPNTVLAIEKYAFDSTTHAGGFDASVKKGTLAVISGKLVKQSPESMRIRTPSSIMGVRGTEFAVHVAERVE
jgi:hypothetical protein